MPTLKVNFLGVSFPNPLVLPSGILQEIPGHMVAVKAGVGGVTLKSLTREKREGNPMPRVIKYESGILNSVGLRNPGIDKGIELAGEFIKVCPVPVIVSIFSVKTSEFAELAKKALVIKPQFLELNLSCPNAVNEMGQPLGMGVDSTTAAVKAVKKTVGAKVKLIAKLSPNVINIGEVAKAAEASGADAICAINTVGPGMVIDIKTRKPMLGNLIGGVSGPGIRPVAVKCVWEIYKSVKLPIIGMGGVEKARDVVEMMLAGATLVGVGSAMYRHGFEVYEKIKADLVKYMEDNKINKLAEIIGGVHE
ncbi:MAG: dihydroorotate dehydrogenase [Candidatus Beckwithbacteria bacterium]|nr:dihydroorotate dehydrogenase [Candidatus Beckwithbacteria bacterium]